MAETGARKRDRKLPRNLGEALSRFGRVMRETSVAQKQRVYYIRWVERFNAFRVEVLRRSLRTCTESDVVGFLQRQRERDSARPSGSYGKRVKRWCCCCAA